MDSDYLILATVFKAEIFGQNAINLLSSLGTFRTVIPYVCEASPAQREVLDILDMLMGTIVLLAHKAMPSTISNIMAFTKKSLERKYV